MKYIVAPPYAGNLDFIEIDEQKYYYLKKIRENILEILYIEENFDLIFRTYLEYENELSKIANEDMIFQDYQIVFSQNARIVINMRIISLLTICKMYNDSTKHHLKNIYDDEKIANMIENKKNNIYDTKLGYRVMESMRNHVQHQGVPIHAFKLNHRCTSMESDSYFEYISIPIFSLNKIKKNKKFKKNIIIELEKKQKKNDYYDIRPYIREYMIGLFEIQNYLREVVKSDLNQWLNDVESIYNEFLKKYPGDYKNSFRLNIAIENKNNIWEESFYLALKNNERIKFYQNRNSLVNNFEKHYSTNKID